MAKLSISLPDALKERLDAYVQEHGTNSSETIRMALERFLDDPTSAPTPPDSSTATDPHARIYLQRLAIQVEMMRQSMQPVMPVPYPLPPPPWYHGRETEWNHHLTQNSQD